MAARGEDDGRGGGPRGAARCARRRPAPLRRASTPPHRLRLRRHCDRPSTPPPTAATIRRRASSPTGAAPGSRSGRRPAAAARRTRLRRAVASRSLDLGVIVDRARSPGESQRGDRRRCLRLRARARDRRTAGSGSPSWVATNGLDTDVFDRALDQRWRELERRGSAPRRRAQAMRQRRPPADRDRRHRHVGVVVGRERSRAAPIGTSSSRARPTPASRGARPRDRQQREHRPRHGPAPAARRRQRAVARRVGARTTRSGATKGQRLRRSGRALDRRRAATGDAAAVLNTNAARRSRARRSPADRDRRARRRGWPRGCPTRTSAARSAPTSTYLTARSTDGGVTWSAPAALNSTRRGLTRGEDARSDARHRRRPAWVAAWESTDTLGGTIGGDLRHPDGPLDRRRRALVGAARARPGGGERRPARHRRRKLATAGGVWNAVLGRRAAARSARHRDVLRAGGTRARCGDGTGRSRASNATTAARSGGDACPASCEYPPPPPTPVATGIPGSNT